MRFWPMSKRKGSIIVIGAKMNLTVKIWSRKFTFSVQNCAFTIQTAVEISPDQLNLNSEAGIVCSCITHEDVGETIKANKEFSLEFPVILGTIR